MKHINNRNDGNDSNVSILSNQSKCEPTVHGRCGKCVHSGKGVMCPFILYVLCASSAVVVGVDSSPELWPLLNFLASGCLSRVQYQWSVKTNATCHNRIVMRLTTNRSTYSLRWVQILTQYGIYKVRKENERKTQNRSACIVVDIKSSNSDIAQCFTTRQTALQI
jgi:hypothetical protein